MTSRRRLTGEQLEVIAFLQLNPLSTTSDVRRGLGLTHGATEGRLMTLYSKKLIARQPPLDLSNGEPWRWQVEPGWMETKSKAAPVEGAAPQAEDERRVAHGKP